MSETKGWVLSSFYFSVSILGQRNSDIAFQEVSGLEKEVNTEEVVSGGENQYKYRLPTTSTFKNLVLKRGISDVKSSFSKWCLDSLSSSLFKPVETKDLTVKLFNEDRKPIMQWILKKAYPVKWSGSDLNSEKNSVFIETIELSYLYFNLKTGNTGTK